MILHRDPDYPCISIVFNHNNALSFLFCYYDNKQKLCGLKPQRKWLGTVLYLDSFMKAAQAAKSFKLVFKNPNSMHIWKIFTVEKSIYYFTLPVCSMPFDCWDWKHTNIKARTLYTPQDYCSSASTPEVNDITIHGVKKYITGQSKLWHLLKGFVSSSPWLK